LSRFEDIPSLTPFLHLLSFRNVFIAIVGVALLFSVVVYIYSHLKLDFHVPGYGVRQSLRTIHLTEPWQKFYDYDLNENVGYAKHAISIDENRKDFARVPWGAPDVKHASIDSEGNAWFEQVWFAGNHSDIGGSYPEIEARLSDITLDWMLRSAAAVPNGIKHDPSVLHLSPFSEGMQHDEVKVGYGLLTRLFGFTWTEEYRPLPTPDTIVHSSVYERFDLPAVQVYDVLEPYRPETLRDHVDFAPYYVKEAISPANSAKNATAMAAEPKGVGSDKVA
jgi:T6SS, Phospholipase effector Tle1-like, catalytic domain